MNKLRRMLQVAFGALFLVCVMLLAASCDLFGTGNSRVDTVSYNVSVSLNDASLGEVILEGEKVGDGYRAGSMLTVTVNPIEDYEAELTINGEDVELDEHNSAEVQVNSDLAVVADIEYIYTVNVVNDDTKGTVEIETQPGENGLYAKDTDITFTVTPKTGDDQVPLYEVARVSVNGVEKKADEEGKYTFKLEGKSYIAVEYKTRYMVTLTDHTGGEVNYDGHPFNGTLFAEGTAITLTAVPDEGYIVGDVYVNHALTAVDENGTFTFTVKGETEVDVKFLPLRAITVGCKSASLNAVIGSENCAVTLTGKTFDPDTMHAAEGDILTIHAVPTDDWTLVKVVVNDVEVKTVNGIGTFEVKANSKGLVHVYVYLLKKQYTVDFSSGDDGIRGNATLVEIANGKEYTGGTATISSGKEVTLKIVPKPGFMLEYLRINNRATYYTDEEKDLVFENGAWNYTFIVKEDIELFADFKEAHHFTVENQVTSEDHKAESYLSDPTTQLAVEELKLKNSKGEEHTIPNPYYDVTCVGKYYYGECVTIFAGDGNIFTQDIVLKTPEGEEIDIISLAELQETEKFVSEVSFYVTQNTVITSSVKELRHEVTLNYNNEEVTDPLTLSVKHGEAINLSDLTQHELPAATWDGHRLVGWQVVIDNQVQADYVNGEFTVADDNIVLNAVWVEIWSGTLTVAGADKDENNLVELWFEKEVSENEYVRVQPGDPSIIEGAEGKIEADGTVSFTLDVGVHVCVIIRASVAYKVGFTLIDGFGPIAESKPSPDDVGTWSVGGPESGTNPLRWSEIHDYDIAFKEYNHNVTLTSNEGGIVELTNGETPVVDFPATIANGTTLTLKVTPDATYRVKSVTVNGVECELNADNVYEIRVTDDTDIVVEFVKTYTVSLTIRRGEDLGGVTITNVTKGVELGNGATFDAGDKISVSIKEENADSHYYVVLYKMILPGYFLKVDAPNGSRWSGGGTYTATPNGDVEVDIEFVKFYNVTVENDKTQGSVTVEQEHFNDGMFEAGEQVTVNIAAKEGYRINTITVDGVEVDTTIEGYKPSFVMNFAMPDTDVTITVTYTKVYEVVSASVSVPEGVEGNEITITYNKVVTGFRADGTTPIQNGDALQAGDIVDDGTTINVIIKFAKGYYINGEILDYGGMFTYTGGKLYGGISLSGQRVNDNINIDLHIIQRELFDVTMSVKDTNHEGEDVSEYVKLSDPYFKDTTTKYFYGETVTVNAVETYQTVEYDEVTGVFTNVTHYYLVKKVTVNGSDVKAGADGNFSFDVKAETNVEVEVVRLFKVDLSVEGDLYNEEAVGHTTFQSGETVYGHDGEPVWIEEGTSLEVSVELYNVDFLLTDSIIVSDTEWLGRKEIVYKTDGAGHAGWSVSFSVTHDIYAHIKYVHYQFHVTVDPMNGEDSSDSIHETKNGFELPEEPATKPSDNCRFGGWKVTFADGREEIHEPGYVVKPTDDIRVEAVWIDTYTIAVNITGEVHGSVEIYDSRSGVLIEKITANGVSEPIDEGTAIKVHITIEEGYWIVFDNCDYGSNDYTIAIKGGSQKGSGTDCFVTGNLTDNAVLNISWLENHVVTVVDGELKNVKDVKDGDSYKLPAAPATREGYRFAGWKVTKTGSDSEEVVDGHECEPAETEITVTCDVTVTAVWVDTYTVTLNVTGASADESNYVVIYSATKVEGQYEVYEKYTGVGGIEEQTIGSDGTVTITLDKTLYICIEAHASVSYYVNLPFAAIGTYPEYPDATARGTWEVTRHGNGDLWSIGEVNVGFELYKHKVTFDGEEIEEARWAVNGRTVTLGHPDPGFETHDGYTFDKYIVKEGEKTTLCDKDSTYGEVYGELTIYSRWTYEVTVNVKTVSDDPEAVGGTVTSEGGAPLPETYYWSMDQEETLLYFNANEGYLVSKVEYDCNGETGEENYPVGQGVHTSSFGVVGMTTLTVTFSKVYNVTVNITAGEELGTVTITNRTTGEQLHHGDKVYAGSSVKIVVGPTSGNWMVITSEILCPGTNMHLSGGTYNGAVDYVGTSFLKGDIYVELKFVKGYTVTLDGEEQSKTVIERGSYTLPDAPAARAGYTFAGWEVDGVEGLKNPGETVDDVRGDLTVTSKWTFAITVNTDDGATAERFIDGSTSEPLEPSYSEGEEITVIVTPKEGYRIKSIHVESGDFVSDEDISLNELLASWTLGGIVDSTTITVTTVKLYTVSGEIEHISYTVSVDESAYCYYDEAANTYTLDEGSSYTIDFTAEEGWLIKSVGFNINHGGFYYYNGDFGNVVITVGLTTYKGTDLNTDVVLEGLAVEGHTITFKFNNDAGEEKTVVRAEGEFEKLPQPGTKEGYRFEGWKVSGIEALQQPNTSITVGASDITVEGQWVKVVTVTMNVTGDANGIIELKKADGTAVQSGETIDVGTKLTLHIKANEGYKVVVEGSVGISGLVVFHNLTMPEITISEFEVSEEGISLTVRYEQIDTHTVNVNHVEGAEAVLSSAVLGESKYYEGEEVTLTVTVESGYQLDSVAIDGAAEYSNEGNVYTFTVGKSDINITINVHKLHKVTVTADGFVQVEITDEKEWYDNGEKVTFTVSVTNSDYKIASVDVTGATLQNEAETYSFVIDGEDVEITVTTVKIKLDNVTFPSVEESAGDVTGAPAQGTWTNGAGESNLVIGADTMQIGGAYVTEIHAEGEGGSVVYTLTTENDDQYTLEWLDDTANYVLVLTAQPKVALASAMSMNAGGVNYYVNSALGEDILHAAWTETLDGDWTNENSTLNISNADGKLALTLDGAQAAYIIAAGENRYFVVMQGGDAAYVMRVTDGGISLDGKVYAKKTVEVEKKITNAFNGGFIGPKEAVICVYVDYEGFEGTEIEGVKLVLIHEGQETSLDMRSGHTVQANRYYLDYTISADLAVGTYSLKLQYDGKDVFTGTIGLAGTLTAEANEKVYTLADGALTVAEKEAELDYTITSAKLGTQSENPDQMTLVIEVAGELFNDFGERSLQLCTQEGHNIGKSDPPKDNVFTIYFDNLTSIATTGTYALKLVFDDNVTSFPMNHFTGELDDAVVTKTVNDREFEFKLGLADGTLTLIVTGKETEANKKVTGVSGAILENNFVYLIIDTVGGYTSDEVKNQVKLCADATVMGVAGIEQIQTVEGQFKVWFNAIIDLDPKDYVLTVKVESNPPITFENLTIGADTSKNFTWTNGNQFSLEVSGEQLILKVVSTTPTEKTVSFAGTAFYFDNTHIRIALNVTTKGYPEEVLKAATIKIGTLTFVMKEFAGAWYYYISGVENENSVTSLSAGKYPVVLLLDGQEYECPTVETGKIQESIQLDGKVYTLKVEEGKLYLEISEKEEYTVRFSAGELEGVTNLPEEMTGIAHGATLSLPEETPALTNHAFRYWYYLDGGQEVKVEAGFVPSDHADSSRIVTLYAKFELTTVVYENQTTGGWSVPAMSDLTISYGQKVTYSGSVDPIPQWYSAVMPVVSATKEDPHYIFIRYADTFLLGGAAAGKFDALAAYYSIVPGMMKIDDAAPVVSTQALFEEAFLNHATTGYTMVVDYTNLYDIVLTTTITSTVNNKNYEYKLVITVTPYETGKTYYLGIACDQATFTGTALKEGAAKDAKSHVHSFEENVCAECGAIQYSDESGYQGVAERVTSFYCNDDSGAWPEAGETATDPITVKGDFALYFHWTVTRDPHYRDSWINITPDNVSYLTAQYQTHWGALFAEDKISVSTDGAIPTADGSDNDWTGDYTILITRIGTTLTVDWHCENGEASWTRTIVATDCTVEDLMVSVVGNYWWHDGLVAHYCAISKA